MGYTAEGYKDTLSAEDKIKAIEVLKTVLGTMVLEPQFETDPSTFKKVLIANPQVPIIQGESRSKALKKLDLLIENL